MPKLKRLIDGQDIAFDTHQAGDGQEMNVEALHMEKRLHEGGKLKFPLFGDMNNPEASGNVNGRTKVKIINEVKSVLKKDTALTKELAQTVFDELERFSNGEATESDAKETAINIARYFDLDDTFINMASGFKGDTLTSLKTWHESLSSPRKIFMITQSKKNIDISYVNGEYTRIKKKLSARRPKFF